MSTTYRKRGGKLRKGVREELPSKRAKKEGGELEGEHPRKIQHRKKELNYGPIVNDLRSMDRKLRSKDKTMKHEEISPVQRRAPKKPQHKRKKAAPKEEEELEIEIVETKRVRGKDMALVHFIGYSHSEDEWKPLSEIHSEETDSERPTEKETKKRKRGTAKEEMEPVKRPKGKVTKGKRKAEEEEKPKRVGRKKKGATM